MLRSAVEDHGRAFQAMGDQVITEYNVNIAAPSSGDSLAWPSPESVRTPLTAALGSPLRDRSELQRVLLHAASGALPATGGGIHVVHGTAGYGKTALARTVFDTAVTEYGVVGLWVTASVVSSFRSGMLAVAHDRGASQEEVDAARSGRRPAADFVWQYLDRSPERWLLVIDNADDPAVFQDGVWLRPSRNGTVLITTRHGNAPVWRDARRHRLDVLEVSDAAQVLQDLAGTAEEPGTWAQLAQRLDGHPLALSLAGSFLGRQLLEPVTVDEYLQRLDEDPSVLDLGADPGERDARRLTATTWHISLDALAGQGLPEATTLLRLLACFAPDPLPVGILAPGRLDAAGLRKADPPLPGARANAALEGLIAKSLATLVTAPAEDDGPAVRSVHVQRLLLDTVAAGTPPAQQSLLLRCAAGLLHQLLATSGDGYVDARTLRLFTPHAIALLRRTATDASRPVDTALSVVRGLRDQTYDRGDYAAAHVLAQEASQVAAGALTAESLTDRHQFGRALSALGRFHEAADTHDATLRDRADLMGGEHPHTLDSAYELGICLYGLGRWADDEQQMRRAAEGRRRVLGRNHPGTVLAHSCLAEAIGQQQRWPEAEILARANLQVSEQALGLEHPQTLISRIALSWVLAGTGQWEEAARHAQETLTGSECVLGAEHPRTLSARQRLAAVQAQLGQWPAAEEAARRVQLSRSKTLGTEHPHTLSVQILLTRILRGSGKLIEARDWAIKTLDSCLRILGDEHPDTRACREEYQAVTAALADDADTDGLSNDPEDEQP